MSKYKRCTDCKHYVVTDSWKASRCHKLRSIVDGGPVIGSLSYPEVQRLEPWLVAVIMGRCGQTARWFEPKAQDTAPPVTDQLGLGNRSGWTNTLGGKP